MRGSGQATGAQQRDQHAPTRAIRARWERNEGAFGGPTSLGRYGSELVRNSFLRLAARRRTSWAALERRAERPDCAPSRGLVSESAVHLVSVMSPRSSRARGRGRRWARIAEGRSMVSVRRVRKACWCRPTAKVRPDGAHVKFWRWARVPTEPGLILCQILQPRRRRFGLSRSSLLCSTRLVHSSDDG